MTYPLAVRDGKLNGFYIDKYPKNLFIYIDKYPKNLFIYGFYDEGFESNALKQAFIYLASSIDAAALLPVSMSRDLITEWQRSECASQLEPYKKAEVFLGHLQRTVNGDYIKFHAFVQVLQETGQASIAQRLQRLHGNSTRH